MNKSFDIIQSEVAIWNNYNFPNNTKENCILGIIEELGELSHCVLKQSQGIRKESSTDEKLKDAIGDIFIYCLNYANYCNINFNNLDIKRDTPRPLDIVMSIVYISDSIRDLCLQSIIYSESALERIIIHIKQICHLKNYDLSTIVNDTWNDVSKRDWIKFPNNGVTN